MQPPLCLPIMEKEEKATAEKSVTNIELSQGVVQILMQSEKNVDKTEVNRKPAALHRMHRAPHVFAVILRFLITSNTNNCTVL